MSTGTLGASKRKTPSESGSSDALRQMMQDQLDELNKKNKQLDANVEELRMAASNTMVPVVVTVQGYFERIVSCSRLVIR